MKRTVAATMLVLAALPVTAPTALAADPVETNVLERIECLFRVYVTEGGEQGLDCLA